MRPLFLLAALVAVCLSPPARASQFGALLDGPAGGWLVFTCGLAGLLMFGAACRQLSAFLAERTHASRIVRLMDVLANQADGVAELLLSHPPAPGATLQAVRQAAIAQVVAYAKVNLPETVAQVGASDAVLATRVANYVSEKLNTAAPTAGAGVPMIAANDVVVQPLAAAAPA